MKRQVANIGSAILAGGRSRRMKGKNKAFISIDGGPPIIRRTIYTLKEISEEIFIVTNSPEDYKLYGKEAIIITDIIKEVGPLGGIHSVLSQTSKEAVFFVACDMPFLHNDIILSQINYFSKINCDCLVAKVGLSIEPLHGIYKKSLKNKIESFLKDNSDYAIRSFLKNSDVGYFELEDNVFYRNAFRNLNTPEDLKEENARCK